LHRSLLAERAFEQGGERLKRVRQLRVAVLLH
jgi:hypothetical protein